MNNTTTPFRNPSFNINGYQLYVQPALGKSSGLILWWNEKLFYEILHALPCIIHFCFKEDDQSPCLYILVVYGNVKRAIWS